MIEPVWNLVVAGKVIATYPTILECVEVLDWLGYIGTCMRAIGA